MELDFLEELLSNEEESTTCSMGHNFPQQFGPMRHYDVTMRCASRGCSSPTHLKLKGIPYCMSHCLTKMNEMLFELGVDK